MDQKTKEKYENWNIQKQFLQESEFYKKIYFHEGDIWWCSLGINLGNESFGKGQLFRRPILILKKLSTELCIALPLTSMKKEGTWFSEVTVLNKKRWVMLNQIRMLHIKRFQHKMAKMNHSDFDRVKEKLEDLLELSQYHHPTDVGIEGIAPQSSLSIEEEWVGSQ